jgi:hypothetical protein
LTQEERKETVILYDSFTHLDQKHRPTLVHPTYEWQVAQLLKKSSTGSVLKIQVRSCQQQANRLSINLHDCGLYAIMNSVSLALGKSPEHIFYKPGFRPQLLEMFRKGEVEMFKHTEWSDTTASRATFQVKIGANKHALIPTTDVAFEAICVCSS